MNGQVTTERILDAFLASDADQLPDRVIDAALSDIARTRQRRALRVPWRFAHMPSIAPATGIAAVALVVVVGAGALFYANSNRPGGTGGQPMPVPTVAPTPAPTSTPAVAPPSDATEVAPGIAGWRLFTSEVHSRFGYPDDWSVNALATRQWQPGDSLAGDAWPYADSVTSPEQDQVGLLVWEMPAGEGAEGEGPGGVESVSGLKAWAERFCTDVGLASCETFTQRAEPMCLNAGGDSCRAALLVSTTEAQYAFFVDWSSAMVTDTPDRVRVVVVPRADDFPSAARYGGSVQLLKSILTTMDVWEPGQAQDDYGWITRLETPSEQALESPLP